jgi:hypothetical protein
VTAIPLETWDWVAIERLAIPVVPGDRLAVALSYATEGDVFSWLIAGDPLEGGEGLCRGVCFAEWTSLFNDYRIRTWVDPAIELDQVADTLDPSSGQSFVDAFIPEWAQTFRVGRDGVLTRFDVKLQATDGFREDDLIWHLLPVAESGAPVEDLEQALASGSIPALSVATATWEWVAVEGLEIAVGEGEELAIALSLPPETTSVYSWLLANPIYADGSQYCRKAMPPPCDVAWTDVFNDFRFRSFLVAALVALAWLAGSRHSRRR